MRSRSAISGPRGSTGPNCGAIYRAAGVPLNPASLRSTPRSTMPNLPLQSVPLPRGVQRDPSLPQLKSVRSGHVHPLRAHCFAATAFAFTPEQRAGVENLEGKGRTYVYEMEQNEKDTIKRHKASRAIKLDRPFAAGLIQKGILSFLRRKCVLSYG